MDNLNPASIAFLSAPALGLFLILIVKSINDLREFRTAKERVLEAEREAFKTAPEAFAAKTAEIVASQEQLEQRTKQITDLIEAAQAALRVGGLFDLYNKQIEKYQTETQTRASWSFISAILAMTAGLGFVIWGGTVIFSDSGWQNVAAGSAISAIGGAVSAYITKTFLDVHQLSLGQLNRYFRQPVLNAHILTAQRLADLLDEPTARRTAYENIIASVIRLIQEEQEPPLAPSASSNTRVPPPSAPKRKKSLRVPNTQLQAHHLLREATDNVDEAGRTPTARGKRRTGG